MTIYARTRRFLPRGLRAEILTLDGDRILYIAKETGWGLVVAINLEEMKEFADTVTAIVAAEEERQERIAENE